MRFMVMVRSTADIEGGAMPTEEDLTAMGAYNEELVNAGIMVDGGGLHPSERGARVNFSGGTATVTDGPFVEVKELIAGYWIWELPSLEEAVAWASRAPMGEHDMLEIRQLFTDEDFGEAYTAALQEQDERLRAQVNEQRGNTQG